MCFCLSLIPGLFSSLGYADNVDYRGLKAIFGEAVTTSATGQPQQVSKTPLSMTIISADEIMASNALDIPQLLRRVAGVDVSRNFKGNADVNIRGYNKPLSNRLLVLINGRQVYMDNLGMTIWSSLPVQLSEIEQIEVVRGPNTALFGFNAASGVVNIITKNPIYDHNDSIAQVRVGTQSLEQSSLVATVHPNDRLAMRLSTGFQYSDGFERDSKTPEPTDEDALLSRSVNLDAIYSLSDTQHLRMELGLNEQIADTLFPYHYAGVYESVARHFKLDYSHDRGDQGVLSLRYYFNSNDAIADPEKFFGVRSIPDYHNHLHVIQAANLWALQNNQTLRLGVEYRHNELEADYVGSADDQFHINTLSTSLMYNWSVTDSVSWINSVSGHQWRSDRHSDLALIDSVVPITAEDYDREEFEYSFNSGLLYQHDERNTYRLSVGRGLHIPSLVEMSRVQTLVPVEVYGNPTLETETLLSAELGWAHQCDGPMSQMQVTLFYQSMDNVIAQTLHTLGVLGGSGGALGDYTFENVGESDAYGIEWIVEGQAMNNQLNWSLNYTYLQHDDTDRTGPAYFVDFEKTMPEHKVNLHLNYDRGPWYYELDLHYVSERSDYELTSSDIIMTRRVYELPDYWIMNAAIGYQLSKQTRLALSGYNMIDDHFEKPGFGFIEGIGVGGANELGASYAITLTHEFE